MRLVRFGPPGAERPGLIDGEDIIDVSKIVDDYDRGFWTNGGSSHLAAAFEADQKRLSRFRLDSVRLGPPVPLPEKLVCVGINYPGHVAESGSAAPKEPVIFMKAPNSIVGPFDDVLIPPNSSKTDWEVELAVIIGAKARYLSDPSAALGVIAGYSISNDVSERTNQLERGGQWVKGKSAETFNPLGPFVATKDEIEDPDSLDLYLSVNNVVRQESNTGECIFSPTYLVWYISQFMVLEPGDIINTGTPAGVGLGMNPPSYLKDGDIMELSITGLGTQRQTCRQAIA
jgi:2-keto-4-pentenoate hydratase/2-oxohepta-3-ene-1,7-dioic acid hydratase in catechol pathway